MAPLRRSTAALSFLVLTLAPGAWAGNSTLPPPLPPAARHRACDGMLGGDSPVLLRVVNSRVNLRLRGVARDRGDFQRGFLDGAAATVEIIVVETMDKGRWAEVDRSLFVILKDDDGVEHRLDAAARKSLDDPFPTGSFTSAEGLEFSIESDLPPEVMLHLTTEVQDELSWKGRVHHQFSVNLNRPLDQSDEWTVVVSTVDLASGETRTAAYDGALQGQEATISDHYQSGEVRRHPVRDERAEIADELAEDITDELESLIIRPVPPPVPQRL